jgi:hypothetical protein
MCTFHHRTYSATGIKKEMKTWMQTNISLLVYDGSTINQKNWWVQPDRAQTAGTLVHSSCSMQTVKGLILTVVKYHRQLSERNEMGVHRTYFCP